MSKKVNNEGYLQDVLGIKYEYFDPYKDEKKKLRQSMQCSVRAITKVTKVDKDKIYDKIISIGKKYNDFGDNLYIVKKVLKKFGFKNMHIENTLVGVFCKNHKKGSYVIGINGHCFPYIDGTIYDCAADREEFTEDTIEYVLCQNINYAYEYI